MIILFDYFLYMNFNVNKKNELIPVYFSAGCVFQPERGFQNFFFSNSCFRLFFIALSDYVFLIYIQYVHRLFRALNFWETGKFFWRTGSVRYA